MSRSVHLSVVRLLLTITTSEHFIAHGDALVQCIKTVFNLAIASDDAVIKRTACNALLQVCAFSASLLRLLCTLRICSVTAYCSVCKGSLSSR